MATVYLTEAEAARLFGDPAPAKRAKVCDGCGRPKTACVCLELDLLQQIRFAGLPEPVTQVVACPPRRFRWDFGWLQHNLLLEIQGLTKRLDEGGHSTHAGLRRDAEKQSLAAIRGFRVLVVTDAEVKGGQALKWIEEALR